MASVFLNKKKSKNWVACFTVGGKQVQRSTRVTDETAAKGIAASFQKTAQHAEAGELTEEYIRDTINFILRLAGRDPMEIPTIRGWLTSWVDNAKAARAPGTATRYEGLKNELLVLLGPKADKTIRALSVTDIEKLRDHLFAEGEAPASINLALKALRGCLSRALAQGLVQHNRALAVDFITKDGDQKAKPWGKRPFTGDELSRILAAAPSDEWRDLIRCGYYIGDRIGNLVLLRIEHFDLVKRILTYTPGKQKRGAPVKTVTIPLHQEIIALVSVKGKKSGSLFPTLSKKRVGGKTGLSLTFRAIIDAAGIKYASKAPRGGRGRTVHEVSFHALRRTFNSDLANSGVSQEIRQLLIGQASKEVNDRYTSIELETLRAAIAKLPSLDSKPPVEAAENASK